MPGIRRVANVIAHWQFIGGVLAGVLVAAVTATVAVVGAQATEPQIDISVIGNHDLPVANVTAADLEVSEDGVSRDVLKIEPDRAAMHIAVMISSGLLHMGGGVPFSSPPPVAANAEQAGLFAKDLQQLADREVTFASSLAQLLAAAPGTQLSLTAQSSVPALVASGFAGDVKAAIHGAVVAGRELAAFSTPGEVINVCDVLRSMHSGRAEIVMTEAFAEEPSDATQQRMLDALRMANATLWVVAKPVSTDPEMPVYEGRSGVPMTPLFEVPDIRQAEVFRQLSLGLNAARNLAIASGGRYIPVENGPPGTPKALSTLAAMLAGEYRVTYSRPVGAPTPAKLVVKTARPGTNVAAPQWPSR
jgi:hypothetical protein